MKSVPFLSGVLLLCGAAIVSLVGMVCRISDSAFAEFLLAFVLAVEGVAAFLHVRQDREESRTERLMQIQKELGSIDWLKLVYRFYRSFPLTTGPSHEIGEPLKWVLMRNDNIRTEYTVEVPGVGRKPVCVDMENADFVDINKIAECYHRIGQLYEREYIRQADFLDFQYLPIVRNWRRLKEFVEKERCRRKSP